MILAFLNYNSLWIFGTADANCAAGESNNLQISRDGFLEALGGNFQYVGIHLKGLSADIYQCLD